MDLQPGTVFAQDYEVQRELSAGGMGKVYVVLQRSTGKQRALKLMLPQLVSDPTLRKRFEQEARVAALIESDHVVEVVGAGVDEASGAPWLAMELLRGEEVSANVVAASGNPLATTHQILRQVCHAVGAAHAAGIVHRDLKPENLFLAESKRADAPRTVKVLDFGIAKIAAEASTQYTAALGSPIWMAPEQSDKGAVTPAADVWALALITYYLLTGKYFWNSAQEETCTIHQVMREVLFAPIPLASQRAMEQGVANRLPPWFDGWFARALVREPAQRIPDATQLFAAFEAAMGGAVMSAPRIIIAPGATMQAMPSVAPPAVLGMTAPAVSMPDAPPPRRSRSAFGIVAALALLLGVGGAVYARHHRATSTVTTTRAAPTTTTSSAPDDTPPTSDVTPAPTIVTEKPKKPKPHHSAPLPSLSAPPPPPESAAPAASDHVPVSEGGFDRAAATDAVNHADLAPCAIDGASGPGSAKVIFKSDGSVRMVVLESEALQGTAAGRCIERRLRGVHIAPFKGLAHAVEASFTLAK